MIPAGFDPATFCVLSRCSPTELRDRDESGN